MKFDDELLHAGIATFCGSDHVTLDKCKDFDVAVIGVPIDQGASYRLGAKAAPRAIREHSMWKKLHKMECYDYDNRKYVTTNEVNLCDLGDVRVINGDQEKTQKEIESVVSKIRETTFPLILGGDHSITYGAYRGVKSGSKLKNIGLLQFDAHNDTEPDASNLPRINHCNQFTTLLNEGSLNGKHMVNIGVRGVVDRTWHDFALSHSVTHITANEFNRSTTQEVLQILREKFEGCDGIYVTFDVDSLEAAYSEGTGTPKYNGIEVMKTLELIRALNEFNVVGFDIVELCPTQDASGISSFISWEILYNFLSFGYNNSANN